MNTECVDISSFVCNRLAFQCVVPVVRKFSDSIRNKDFRAVLNIVALLLAMTLLM
jgi:hypothetical protein